MYQGQCTKFHGLYLDGFFKTILYNFAIDILNNYFDAGKLLRLS